MPPAVYTSDASLRPNSTACSPDWLCLGRASALAEPGDYVAWEIAGQPVAVVRDREGRLHAFSNVCLHRMSTLLHGRGHARRSSAPITPGPTISTARLRGAPAMTRNDRFRREDYCLPRVRCEEWLGWVFVTLNPDAEPVAERLRRGRGADRATTAWRTTSRPSARPTSGTPTGRCSPRTSWRATTCRSAMRRRSAALSKLDEMVCPPGGAGLQLPHDPEGRRRCRIAIAHPVATPGSRATGGGRRSCSRIYPSLL